MSDRTKAELARRLRMVESDLISRKETGAILDLDEHTLRTKSEQHVGFFKLSDDQTARALYPKRWVIEYKAWRDEGKKQSFDAWLKQNRKEHFNIKLGFQEKWPDGPDPKPLGLNDILLLLARWKYKELVTRCEWIIRGGVSRDELLLRHYECVLYDENQKIRAYDDPEVRTALMEKAREIVFPVTLPDFSEPIVSAMHMEWDYFLEKELELISFMR